LFSWLLTNMTAGSPNLMSSFRSRHHAVKRQSARHASENGAAKLNQRRMKGSSS
jgi:hypothetical protein